jgi:hypothetical protein
MRPIRFLCAAALAAPLAGLGPADVRAQASPFGGAWGARATASAISVSSASAAESSKEHA